MDAEVPLVTNVCIPNSKRRLIALVVNQSFLFSDVITAGLSPGESRGRDRGGFVCLQNRHSLAN